MKPIVGITMGDPGSIGPEITIKAWKNLSIHNRCRPVVIGDANVLENAKKYMTFSDLVIRSIPTVQEAIFDSNIINVIDLKLIDIEKLKIGEITKESGDAAFQYIVKTIDLAMKGEIDATVTNAISKEAINLAGHHYSGHTEIYAEYTHTDKYTMMLVHKDLRVVHVSTHVSLREACDRAKKERVLDVIQIANSACKEIGIRQPKIAVAGLNPHCGENGMFGHEEIDEIIPAIKEAKQMGIIVEGPIPPDTVFSKANGGWYDIVVCMYHDQGHIPLKVQGFQYNRQKQEWDAVEGVNITLGLPIIRCSVDHGTAFDHAGKGDANELSLVNAIDYAIKMANARQ